MDTAHNTAKHEPLCISTNKLLERKFISTYKSGL